MVVWDQLIEHCLAHGLIHPNHHGSIPGHDCVTAVGHLQNTVTKAADARLLSAVVILDQTAAFDLVDQRTLLLKMQAHNFSKETVLWFHSYLTGRTYSTRIEASLNESRELGA